MLVGMLNSINSSTTVTVVSTIDNRPKGATIVVLWQHEIEFLAYFHCVCAKNGKKIWPRHSLRRPRFPIKQMYFHYRRSWEYGWHKRFCTAIVSSAARANFLNSVFGIMLTARIYRVQIWRCWAHYLGCPLDTGSTANTGQKMSCSRLLDERCRTVG